MVAEEFFLQLDSGQIRARRIGSPTSPLVFLLHGLSSHMHAFDIVCDGLAGADRQLVALDLRGRGQSEVTAAGSYGLDAHCRDVLQVATLLGAQVFDLIGWSMGAQIAIGIASREPQRVSRLVLIDHAGFVSESGAAQAQKGLDRLDRVVKKAALYVASFRAASGIAPWSSFWERYFLYELAPYSDGYKATTSKQACLEDLNEFRRHEWPSMWRCISAPTLLIRCRLPLEGIYFVPDDLADDISHAIPGLRVIDVDYDHNTVIAADGLSSIIDCFFCAT